MASIYVVAGVRHFTHPDFYVQIIPPQLPLPIVLVYLSGAIEIFLGLLLVPTKTRRISAWGIIALLIAVFPANIHMWLADIHIDGKQLPAWFHAVRIPFQFLLMWWAYKYTRPEMREISS